MPIYVGSQLVNRMTSQRCRGTPWDGMGQSKLPWDGMGMGRERVPMDNPENMPSMCVCVYGLLGGQTAAVM